MTRKECVDGMQRIIDEDRNKILVRVHIGYLIHAVKYLEDQQEIVRCKDCSECYYASNRVPSERTYSCGKHGIDVTLDWFCADGERR